MDCTGTNVTAQNISNLGIYLEGSTGWTEVGSQASPTQLDVSAQLQHFSQYRAGW